MKLKSLATNYGATVRGIPNKIKNSNPFGEASKNRYKLADQKTSKEFKSYVSGGGVVKSFRGENVTRKDMFNKHMKNIKSSKMK